MFYSSAGNWHQKLAPATGTRKMVSVYGPLRTNHHTAMTRHKSLGLTDAFVHVTDKDIVYIQNDVIKFRCTVINAWNTLRVDHVDRVDFFSFAAFKRIV